MRFFLTVAAISTITLAASGPIYSGVSGWQVTGHTSASKVATSGSTTASGQCSRTTALQVMTRYHLVAEPTSRRPIGQVLCGAFAGPGSRAMAASSTEPTCLPFAGWGVFRYSSGGWRLIPGGRHPNILNLGIARSGNNIVEKATIRYPGETICLASGVRARVWHWNGSRLVAGPWMVISTGPKTVQLDNFLSPDRKVWCTIFKDSVEDRAWCVVSPGTNPPSDHSAEVHANGEVKLCKGSCTQNWDKRAPVLRYGQQSELYGYRCTSERKGITCTVIAGAGKGKGFLINTGGVTRVGP
jgi:hypothetical protein